MHVVLLQACGDPKAVLLARVHRFYYFITDIVPALEAPNEEERAYVVVVSALFARCAVREL